jgi:hypothetical protein
MGVVRTILMAVLGPAIIYAVLMGHVICRHFVQAAEPLDFQDFPQSTSKDARDSLVASRKPLIKDFMDAMGAKADEKKFVSIYLTEDADFEDPLQRWSGTKEMTNLLTLTKSYLKDIDFNVHGEHHGPHEIVMDWTPTVRVKLLPNYPFSLRMRTHILLEPASKAGKEKIFRMFSEWNGCQLLNEKTTFPMLGRIHLKMRKFYAFVSNAIVENGWV